MNQEIYIVPRGNRYLLIRSDKSVAGSKWGYKSLEAAKRALWYLKQARTAIIAEAKAKNAMAQELKHFRNI